MHGKFAKVHWDRQVQGKDHIEWVSIADGLEGNLRSAIDPEDESRWKIGGLVACRWPLGAPPSDGKVIETYGAMVKVEHRIAGVWWAHGDECKNGRDRATGARDAAKGNGAKDGKRRPRRTAAPSRRDQAHEEIE